MPVFFEPDLTTPPSYTWPEIRLGFLPFQACIKKIQSFFRITPQKRGVKLSTYEGMSIMPSNILLSGTETALFNVMSRENILKTYISKVKGSFDYVIIDCMPSLGMMTINALTAADRVIIPTQPSFFRQRAWTFCSDPFQR